MATKNNRRTVLTKRIFKETLMDLMKEKPISKITIKEICDLADMSRSTFYLHYQDQYDLLEDIEKEVLENTFKNLHKLNSELTAIESITFFLQYVRKNKTVFSILLCQSETHSFQEGIMQSVQSYIQTILPEISDKLEENYMYSFIMHGCLHVIIDWIYHDFNIPEEKLARFIYYACEHIVPR